MSRILLAVAIDDFNLGPQAAKEAAAMALEHLGGVQVLQVDLREPEQMGIANALTKRPIQPDQDDMVYCVRCAHYRKQRGQDETGRPFWGVCQMTDSPVYRLGGRCKDWTNI